VFYSRCLSEKKKKRGGLSWRPGRLRCDREGEPFEGVIKETCAAFKSSSGNSPTPPPLLFRFHPYPFWFLFCQCPLPLPPLSLTDPPPTSSFRVARSRPWSFFSYLTTPTPSRLIQQTTPAKSHLTVQKYAFLISFRLGYCSSRPYPRVGCAAQTWYRCWHPDSPR
jgi:hypothetical protein